MENKDYVAQIAQNNDLSGIALNCMGYRLCQLEEMDEGMTPEQEIERQKLSAYFGQYKLMPIVDDQGDIHWVKNN
jgi:hypothetical protein